MKIMIFKVKIWCGAVARLILNIGKLKLPDFACLAPEFIPQCTWVLGSEMKNYSKKMNFYYENHDFLGEKQASCNSPKMGLSRG